MEIFYRLLFGHLLADFTFQTNHIADWKRKSMNGLLVHVLIHPVCYIALTWPFLHLNWGFGLSGWACVAIAAVLHFVEDWFRVTMVNRGWADNTLFYVFDQVVHIAILWALSPIGKMGVLTQWPLIGILFVVVTHFATVTVYFIEKDIYGVDYPETEEKYISMLVRLVVWLSFFLPHPWWIFVSSFVIFTFARHVWQRRIDFSWTSVALGQLIAIGSGVLCRFVLRLHF